MRERRPAALDTALPIDRCRSGFTLIELSIVLVIIGLIVGGVLVGRDLIEAARVRGAISQIESYKTALNTFRLKFGGLPGDIAASMAAAFGMAPRSGSLWHGGDGDGQFASCIGASAYAFGCDTALFWRDLSDASLIGGGFTDNIDDQLTVSSSQREHYLPESKLPGNYVTVFTDYGIKDNWFVVTGIKSIDDGQYSLSDQVTPQQAYAIDSKIDDGRPLANGGGVSKGNVLGFGTWTGNTSDLFNSYAPNCVDLSAAPDHYSYLLDAAHADNAGCRLLFRMSR